MANTKHLMIVAVVLAASSGLFADDWRGFHGLEKQGRCDSATRPLNWSSSQNVAWKTAIPGRGHSSPIVSADKVYLTTTHETVRHSQNIWNYIVFALTVLFTIIAIVFAMQNIGLRQPKMRKAWQHVRFFLFTQLLVSVIVVVLFGRHLLKFDDDITRYWLFSIAIVLSCLMLSSLFVPLKSRQQLVASILSFLFVIPIFITFKQKGLAFAPGSLKGLIIIAALLSPLILAIALLTTYLLSRKHQSAMILSQDGARITRSIMWHFMVTGSLAFVAALTPFFFLLYRAAGYQMPDSYIWNDRIKPSISWWCIALYVTLVIITITSSFWKSVRGRMGRSLPLQRTFFVVALSFGIAFFAHSSLIESPKEFIRAIVCLNCENGEILWTCEGLVGQARGEKRTVTHASATPVTDGERIYGYFGEDGLMCVSPQGMLLWKKTEPMFNGKYGAGTSPIVKDNILIVVSDVRESDESSSITAFDCVSGQLLWQNERKSHKDFAAYNTPVIKLLNGREVVIVHGWHDIIGYDLKTGRELWSYPMFHEGHHLVASPVADTERLYVLGAKQISAFDLLKLGASSNPLVWSKPIVGEKSSTPVVLDGLMFLVTESGMAYCFEAQTGEIVWKKRLDGRYYSSIVTMGNKVLFTNESGQTTIVAADREFQQLARNTLERYVYASVVPVGNQLFIRTTRHLYCIQEDKP